MSAPSETPSRIPEHNPGNWHEDAYFGIHYDLHATVDDTELGAELTEEHLIERWSAIQPDWVQCDCKGHPGYTSWPTKVGSASPGIVKDSLAIHRSATRKLGIKLGMHYSGIYDELAIELHPEWANIHSDGEADNESICLLSGYVENLMIPQMLEVIHKYDVDGFWVDGDNFSAIPCWCERCRAAFSAQTGIRNIPSDCKSAHWERWLSFHRDLFVEYVKKYADAIHEAKPTCLVCSNWMYTVRQPDPIRYPIDYISGDFTPWWGGDRAAMEGRMIDSRNISWDLMAWGFGVVGDPDSGHERIHIPKSPLHLCQEISEVISLGGATMVYMQPLRNGWLNSKDCATLKEVATFARKRKETCFKSKSASEAAVLHLASHYYANNVPLFKVGEAAAPLQGALHCLLENHISADITSRELILDDPSRYRLICIPEQIELDEELIEGLVDFVDKGGIVLASGSHLAKDYGPLFGVHPAEDRITTPYSIPVADGAFPMYGEWQPVLPGSNAVGVINALSSMDQEKGRTKKVVVTRRHVGKGAFVSVHGPVFSQYFMSHTPVIREFIGTLISSLNISWQATVTAPPWVEVILRRKQGDLIINLLNRGSCETMSASRYMVEAVPSADDIKIKLSMPEAPGKVTLIPDGGNLEYKYEDGSLSMTFNGLYVHTAIRVEGGQGVVPKTSLTTGR